jgi:hypothetical protein
MIKSRRMSGAAYVARMGEKGIAYRLLARNPEGKSPVGRTRHRWVNLLKWISERYNWLV